VLWKELSRTSFFFFFLFFLCSVFLLFCNGISGAAAGVMVAAVVGCGEGETDGGRFGHSPQLWRCRLKMGVRVEKWGYRKHKPSLFLWL